MKGILLLVLFAVSLTRPAPGQSGPTSEAPASSPAAAPSSAPAATARPGSPLTPEEDEEVNKAHAAALAADPTLATEERALWGKFKAARDAGQGLSSDVKSELRVYNARLEAAMIRADPKVERLLAKLDATRPSQNAK